MTKTIEHSYSSGHPWYYVLGGSVLMPSEILTAVRASGYQGYMAERIYVADALAEPKRSESLRAIKANVLNHFWADLSRYREVVRELRSYRRSLGAMDTLNKCKAVHESVSLKHNHLYNNFAHLVRLDDLLSKQPDLFDL
jgi:hypothetical protein